MLSIEFYFTTYTLGIFNLAFCGFSPTELRLLLAVAILVVYFRRSPLVTALSRSYRLFDVGGAVGIARMMLILVISLIRNTITPYRAKRLHELDRQRLWDELSISIPPGRELDAAVLDRITEKVGSETRALAEVAEREWSGIAQANGISEFDVTPVVGLRPTLTGRDLVIRYITNARSRFATRVKLQHELIAILQSTAQE